MARTAADQRPPRPNSHLPKESEIDAVTAATCISNASAKLDKGSAAPPQPFRKPGVSSSEESVDACTGATPGIAAACQELGLASSDEVSAKLGIKPPGEA